MAAGVDAGKEDREMKTMADDDRHYEIIQVWFPKLPGRRKRVLAWRAEGDTRRPDRHLWFPDCGSVKGHVSTAPVERVERYVKHAESHGYTVQRRCER